METDDAKRVVGSAIQEAGIDEKERPRLLTDNGSCYISKECQMNLTVLKNIFNNIFMVFILLTKFQ